MVSESQISKVVSVVFHCIDAYGQYAGDNDTYDRSLTLGESNEYKYRMSDDLRDVPKLEIWDLGELVLDADLDFDGNIVQLFEYTSGPWEEVILAYEAGDSIVQTYREECQR